MKTIRPFQTDSRYPGSCDYDGFFRSLPGRTRCVFPDQRSWELESYHLRRKRYPFLSDLPAVLPSALRNFLRIIHRKAAAAFCRFIPGRKLSVPAVRFFAGGESDRRRIL